jgi:aspartate/methionine/tyrosine aminotransferase
VDYSYLLPDLFIDRREHGDPVSRKYIDRHCDPCFRSAGLFSLEPKGGDGMNFQRVLAQSPYMEFAKLHPATKYDLSSSGMASFPLRELVSDLSGLEINGPTLYGYVPLNEAIAKRYRVPVESVVAANGTAMANYLAMAATVNPGEEILIEQPTYPLLLDLEKNVSRSTKLIVLCNLHNPSGVLTSRDTLKAIGEIAKRVGARVMVDEVYLETLWESEPQSAFHIDPDVFISTNSLTKAYGLSGLRCGWVLAAAELAERMWRINDLHGATPVHIGELLSVMAFAKLGDIAQKQKNRLDENRALLKRLMESQSKLDYVWAEHGTVIAPRIKQGPASEFSEALRKKFELSVVPGNFFEMPQHIRIGVGGPTEEVGKSLEQLRLALNT